MSTTKAPAGKDRNEDPITGEAGAHPVGVGVGTAGGGAGGAAIGAAIGTAVAGPLGTPVGAVIGAVVGGLTGGLTGKAVAEAIDPTEEEAYWSENYASRPYAAGATFEQYRPAYRYGTTAASQNAGRSFEAAEPELRAEWSKSEASSGLAWEQARSATKDAYDRVIRLHEERLHVSKTPVKTGEVSVRKEVVTERKTIEVPVEREEVVIERRAVGGAGGAGEIKAEQIRIPVKEERVHVTKTAHVKEEVSVSKRKVEGTETVSGDVRHEEVRVEETGDVKVRGKGDAPRK